MADACYTARATTREQITAYNQKLDLPATNNNYQYDDAVKLIANTRRVLTVKYNLTTSNSSGMSKLLDADGAISVIKSTDITTINSIIRKSNARAKKINSGIRSPPLQSPHGRTHRTSPTTPTRPQNPSWEPKKASRRQSLPRWAAPSPTPSYAPPTAKTTKGLTNTT